MKWQTYCCKFRGEDWFPLSQEDKELANFLALVILTISSAAIGSQTFQHQMWVPAQATTRCGMHECVSPTISMVTKECL